MIDSFILLDERLDAEVAGSYTPYHERELEHVTFYTTKPDSLVMITLDMPFTVHSLTAGAYNAGVRVYLDEIGPDYLMANGGQWCTDKNVAVNGRVSHTKIYRIAEQGEHNIFVRMQASAASVIVVLRSRRNYQVVDFSDVFREALPVYVQGSKV